MGSMRVVLATSNVGKQRELAQLLAPLHLELVLAREFGIGSAPETGESFAANAEQKARYVAQHSGLPALADDSGLEVEALDGRPGIYSARYAGPGASDADNNARLLAELAGLPPERRGARYQCVLAYVGSAADADVMLAQGSWEGRIAQAPAGRGGFGYDPLFIPEGYRQTVAELEPTLKQTLSHRARAARALIAQFRVHSAAQVAPHARRG
jgi:XTP/dITP diphosphohydrolase